MEIVAYCIRLTANKKTPIQLNQLLICFETHKFMVKTTCSNRYGANYLLHAYTYVLPGSSAFHDALDHYRATFTMYVHFNVSAVLADTWSNQKSYFRAFLQNSDLT